MSFTINGQNCAYIGRTASYYREEALHYADKAEQDRRESESFKANVDFLQFSLSLFSFGTAQSCSITLSSSYADSAATAEAKSVEFVNQFHRYTMAYQNCLAAEKAEKETVLAVADLISRGLSFIFGM